MLIINCWEVGTFMKQPNERIYGDMLLLNKPLKRRTRKSILLKTADNVGMEIENIFDYFSDIKIISNHDGYFYSVKEALKILLLGLLCGCKNIREIHEWATEDIIKEKLRKEFGIEKIPCYYWLTCLLKLINVDSLNECFMNMAEALIKEYGTEKPLTIAIDGKTIRSTDKMSSYESP